MLDRLSVFPGSFTLDAAETICGPAVPDGEADLDVLDGMGVLVDRSLVQVHPATDKQAEDRYDLLVSIRGYSAERLHSAGLMLALADRHAAYYTELTTYPADSTWEDIEGVDRDRRDELHHLRAALEYAHTHGTVEAGHLVAAHATRALYEGGFQAEAEAVAARALRRSAEATPGSVLLLADRAGRASWMLRWDQARPDALDALTKARQTADGSLLVYALGEGLRTARTLMEYRGWVAEAEDLLNGSPPTSPALPWWWIRYRWDNALGSSPLTPPPRAEAAYRRQLATAPPAQKARVSLNLVKHLCEQARWEEARDLVSPWETADRPPDTSIAFRLTGAGNASELRMALGQLEQATKDVDLLDRLIREHDTPDWAGDLQLRRAALDRLSGQPDHALHRLADMVADSASSAADRAAGWRLLAVLARETGDGEAAQRHLEEAWRLVATQGPAALDLALHCLLERATQLTGPDPAEAVRLIGLVQARRPVERVADFGVIYDMQTILDELRARLGSAVVDTILTDAATQPLPDQLDWSTSPTAHPNHAV